MAVIKGIIKKRYPKRGFASMDKKRRAEIAGIGGKAAHARGTAHEWNSKTGRAAGKLGGKQSGISKREAMHAE